MQFPNQPGSDALSLVRAAMEHIQIVYDWVNDQETRANSFTQEPVPYGTHQSWFERKIVQAGSYYYICLDSKGTPVGQVRFDAQSEESDVYLISFGTAPDARGKGFGSRILGAGINQLRKDLKDRALTFIGFVKEGNVASTRIFEKLGFHQEKAAGYQQAWKYTLHL